MPKTENRKTYSDDEAERMFVSQTRIGDALRQNASLLIRILGRMRTTPLQRMLDRLFIDMGKARRMALCKRLEISYSPDSLVCVQTLRRQMVTQEGRDMMIHDPYCQNMLIEYLGGPDVLRKAKAEG